MAVYWIVITQKESRNKGKELVPLFMSRLERSAKFEELTCSTV
jgi:hypothetical protein